MLKLHTSAPLPLCTCTCQVPRVPCSTPLQCRVVRDISIYMTRQARPQRSGACTPSLGWVARMSSSSTGCGSAAKARGPQHAAVVSVAHSGSTARQASGPPARLPSARARLSTRSILVREGCPADEHPAPPVDQDIHQSHRSHNIQHCIKSLRMRSAHDLTTCAAPFPQPCGMIVGVPLATASERRN